MFVIERAPIVIYHLYQLSFAIMAALITIILFPFTTVTFMLIGLIVWDMFSVLSPCGPLKLISKNWEKMIIKKQEDLNEVIENNNFQEIKGQTSESLATKSIDIILNVCLYSNDGTTLGLGDFVYFSILVAECGLVFPPMVAITSVLCLVVGLMITLCLVTVFKRSMPALPISLMLAFINIIVMINAVDPFNGRLISYMIFI